MSIIFLSAKQQCIIAYIAYTIRRFQQVEFASWCLFQLFRISRSLETFTDSSVLLCTWNASIGEVKQKESSQMTRLMAPTFL